MSALGRGPALKSVKKQHYEVAKAEAKGRLEGEAEAQRKKPIDVSIKEHIGKFIDNIHADDVIKLAAWLGLAYIIKPVIDHSQEVQEKIKIIRARRKFETLSFQAIEGFTWLTIPEMIDILVKGGIPQKQIDDIKADIEREGPEHWLLALTTSACIIIFGPVLLSTLGGITKLAGLLIT